MDPLGILLVVAAAALAFAGASSVGRIARPTTRAPRPVPPSRPAPVAPSRPAPLAPQEQGPAPLQGPDPTGVRGAVTADFARRLPDAARAVVAWARHYRLDPLLMEAIARQESSLDPNAVNPADPSYGLFQILCSGPGTDGRCTNRLPAFSDWPPTRESLFNPERSAYWATRLMRHNIDAHGSIGRALIVYNGGPQALATGVSDRYANRVLAIYQQIGKEPRA